MIHISQQLMCVVHPITADIRETKEIKTKAFIESKEVDGIDTHCKTSNYGR